ncbi:MAG: Choice-of-anchor protein, partial [Bacteroidota bacterium]|nr:Choice-of-anchor protein [Bacteroidota bacterium]
GPCYFTNSISMTGAKNELLVQNNPQRIDFGQSIACDSIFACDTLTIHNSGKDNLIIDISKIIVANPFSVGLASGSASIMPSDSLKIPVIYYPDNSVNVYSETMIIPYQAGSCNDTLAIPLNGERIEPSFQASFTHILFPPLTDCVDCTDTTIIITNTGGISVQLTGLNANSELKIKEHLPINIPSGEQREIKISFCPKELGQYEGSMEMEFFPCNKTIRYLIQGSKQGSLIVTSDTIDLGELIYCKTKSISVSDSIIYLSSGSLDGTITAIDTEGPFRTSIAAGGLLHNSGSNMFNIYFEPDSLFPDGVAIGKIYFKIDPCEKERTIYLKAIKSNVDYTALTDVDFGKRRVNTDSTIVIYLKNNGTARFKIVNVNGTAFPFSIEKTEPQIPAWLEPADELAVYIKFSPDSKGLFNSKISLTSSEPCNFSTQADISGEALNNTAKTLVYIPDAKAYNVEEVIIPLIMNSKNELNLAGAQSYSATISYNRTILAPVQSAAKGYISGGRRYINLSGGINDTLAVMNMIAALGDADSSLIKIEGIEYNDGDITITKQDGIFRLLGVCYEGGARFFKSDGSVALFDCKPNPANDKIIFEFRLIEDGASSLYLINYIGQRVETVFETEKSGSYKIEYKSEMLENGIYFYILQTPTERIGKKVAIVR